MINSYIYYIGGYNLLFSLARSATLTDIQKTIKDLY